MIVHVYKKNHSLCSYAKDLAIMASAHKHVVEQSTGVNAIAKYSR